MNGAAGRRVYGFDSTLETVRATPSARSACTSASATRSSSTTAFLQLAGVVEVAAGRDALAVEPHEPGGERRGVVARGIA